MGLDMDTMGGYNAMSPAVGAEGEGSAGRARKSLEPRLRVATLRTKSLYFAGETINKNARLS